MQAVSQPPEEPSRPPPDRHEPLPGLAGLPAFVWRRLPRAARVAVAFLPIAAGGLALLFAPGIDRSKDERARAEAERLAELRAERIERLRAEQEPRRSRGRPAGTDLAARADLLGAARAAVGADARARVESGALAGPVLRVMCEPFPRTADGGGAHRDAGQRVGRYACLAVTTDVPATELNEAAAIGHPYRVRIDFDSGRFALCKVAGRPGEGSIRPDPAVTVPRACGGR